MSCWRHSQVSDIGRRHGSDVIITCRGGLHGSGANKHRVVYQYDNLRTLFSDFPLLLQSSSSRHTRRLQQGLLVFSPSQLRFDISAALPLPPPPLPSCIWRFPKKKKHRGRQTHSSNSSAGNPPLRLLVECGLVDPTVAIARIRDIGYSFFYGPSTVPVACCDLLRSSSVLPFL
jgi:hypothetical protein